MTPSDDILMTPIHLMTHTITAAPTVGLGPLRTALLAYARMHATDVHTLLEPHHACSRPLFQYRQNFCLRVSVRRVPGSDPERNKAILG